MAPLTHYTEQPSRLSASSAAAYLRVLGGGFVTREMLEQTLEDLRREVHRDQAAAVLVDLREVAGYETSCLLPARQFLREAVHLGVRRIALVAESSVMRTASRLAAQEVAVELRTFEHEPSAVQWLLSSCASVPSPAAAASLAGVVAARHHASSSSASAAAP